MNKFFLGVIFLLAFFQTNFLVASELEYYVSNNGADDNPGTLAEPYKHLSRAIEVISSLSDHELNGLTSVTVFLKEGIYFEDETIIIDESLKLGNKFSLEIKAYNSNNVILHGGKKLDGSHFKLCSNKAILERLLPEVRGKVWMIDLKREGIFDFGKMKQHGFGTTPEPAPLEVFINGEPLILARYPNEGKLAIGKIFDKGSVPRSGDFSNRGAEFGYEYDRVDRWKDARDIWLHGKFSYGYNDDHLKVEQINWDKKSFKIAQPHLYGVSSTRYSKSGDLLENPSFFRGYYAYNILEEIDQPGEYYLDRAEGKIYLYPPTDLREAEIEVSLKESPFISIENTSNIQIEDISFACSRGLAVYMNNCSDIVIDDCDFYNLGTVAVSMGQTFQKVKKEYYSDGSPKTTPTVTGDFKNITISNCLVYHTGTGGFVINGGTRRNLKPGNILVYNSEFYQTDRINNTYSPAIKLGGVGNKIKNCNFHDLKHQAIRFSGNDHVIEYCRFNRICYDADDMGAIYTGRNPSERGTVIQFNYFSNILPKEKNSKMCGVYIDDGSGGIIVKNNFFYKVGNPGTSNFAAVFFHGGFDNQVNENIFMDCIVAVGASPWDKDRWAKFLEKPLLKKRLLGEVDITGDLYLQKYPDLKDYFEDYGRRVNYVGNNFLIRTKIAINGDFILRKNITRNDLGQDPENLDFNKVGKLPEMSSFPFDKVGVLYF